MDQKLLKDTENVKPITENLELESLMPPPMLSQAEEKENVPVLLMILKISKTSDLIMNLPLSILISLLYKMVLLLILPILRQKITAKSKTKVITTNLMPPKVNIWL
jgi:hypothetical protein